MNSDSQKIASAAAWAIVIVFVHLAINLAHGMAHGRLEIGLDVIQKIFVFTVIFVTPLIAAYFLWKRRARVGGPILGTSMAGALAFGIYFHFVLPGPDNVSTGAPAAVASWHKIFVATAYALAIVQALGALLGAIVYFCSAADRAKIVRI
jgi:hypothetical protein